MKRLVQLCSAVAAAAIIAACTGSGADQNVGANATSAGHGTPGATGTAGTSTDVDRDFVMDQLAMGEKEIMLGRLAQERGGSADVRAFGGMMVADHTRSGDELRQIGSRHSVTPHAGAKKDHDDAHQRLARMSGAQFDRAYMEMMVEDHQEGIDDVRKKAESNNDHADLKQWSVKALPVMEKHLERARQIREQLERSNQR